MWHYCKDCFWSAYEPGGNISLPNYFCCKDNCYPADVRDFEWGCDFDRRDMSGWRQNDWWTDTVESMPPEPSAHRIIPSSILRKLQNLIKEKEDKRSKAED